MRHNVSLHCLATVMLIATSSLHAAQRSPWDTDVKISAAIVDDAGLEAVSGKGSLEDQAVKALQNGAKINDVLGALGQLSQQNTLALDSADKQAAQTQLRLAQNATHTVGQALQVTTTVNFMATPVSPAPVVGLPLLGLPMLPR